MKRETGLVERNAHFTGKQEKTVSGEQGQDSNEAKHQTHVNVLEPKEDVKHNTDNEILHRQIERLWKIDFEGSAVGTDTLPSIEDNKALNKMEKSLQRVGDHFQVALPWCEESPCFPTNKPMAEQRLQLLKKRLLKDEDLLTKNRTTMQEYIAEGYAQRVPGEELHCRCKRRTSVVPSKSPCDTPVETRKSQSGF